MSVVNRTNDIAFALERVRQKSLGRLIEKSTRRTLNTVLKNNKNSHLDLENDHKNCHNVVMYLARLVKNVEFT